MATQNLTLHIAGMSCGHCLNAVNQALAGLPGVSIDSVRIGRADLRFDDSQIRPPQIMAAVEDAGYSATIAEAARG
ncbi:MAG TPA: cation transporter [Gemmatimonadales bacterium]|nr:cation transporter [Gemmatimonadales bacterium]